MSVVTDKKLIEELNTLSKQNKSPIPTDSEEVTDENLINELEEIRTGSTFKGKAAKAVAATKEFFTGTKRTEFPELPEIGDLKLEDGKATAAITAGLLINPNQKAQAQINKAKWTAAVEWCSKKGMVFRVLTENEIFTNPTTRKPRKRR